MTDHRRSIRDRAFDLLMTADPLIKAQAAGQLFHDGTAQQPDEIDRLRRTVPLAPVREPGRPPRPALVPPRELPRRITHTQPGRNAMAHAFAHIEFNAINIALDAVYRFDDMPAAFYYDWLQVAAEEGRHFLLLQDYLAQNGCAYGDFAAHNSLWETVSATDHDVMVRMALVPRVLEARGLDVTPAIADKLRVVGDQPLVDILGVIYRDEIGHVEIGTRWFRYCAEQRQLDPRSTFRELLTEYMQGRIRGPYDEPGRLAAGFTPEEIDDLKVMEAETLARLDGAHR